MTFWSLDNIKAILGGSWASRPEAVVRAGAVSGVTIDSRAVAPGQMFIAIKGETHDGHDHVNAAVKAGAVLAVVSRAEAADAAAKAAAAVLVVPSTRAALLRLGHAYRKTLDTTRVIAVAGSNGKTTTVRLIQSILSRRLRGVASPKSFNNDIGVPLTLLSAKRGDQYIICEVGTNHPGEIAPLAAAIEPDIGVITSIGREHLEGLGSIQGVVQEETSLFHALRPGGLAVLSADSEPLMEYAKRLPLPQGSTTVRFGVGEDADLRITGATATADGVTFGLNGRGQYRVGLLGLHNASNAAAAIAVARRMGIDQADIEAGLAAATGPDMRMQRSVVAGVTFINDAYNANPESMLASFAAFRGIAATPAAGASGGGRRVVILGDMLELGDASRSAHAEIGAALRDAKVADLAIFTGGAMMHAAMAYGLGAAYIAASDESERIALVAAQLKPGDTVLLKGSRGMALERIIKAWQQRAESVAASGDAAVTENKPRNGAANGPTLNGAPATT